MRILLFFFILLIPSSFSYASGIKTFQSDSEPHSHSHWELGIATGSVLLLAEDHVALGMHIHILRKMHFWDKLSLGVGLETVLDKHTHFNSAFVGAVNVWQGLVVAVSPGVLFLKEDVGWEKDFSSHFELLYHFNLGKVHLGPTFEYSYSKHDKHLMLGIHLGIHL